MTQPTDPTTTLHDQLFKDLLLRFLEPVPRLFFPEQAAELDFSYQRSAIEPRIVLSRQGGEPRIEWPAYRALPGRD